VFPLQVLGYDVDIINSCQLSNHTGYPSFKGNFLSGEQVDTIANGLDDNGLLNYDFVLTGYIANVSFLASVVELVGKIRAVNPSVRWVADPVLGDNGVLYVRGEMIQALKDTAVPGAYMITPNQMEAELLSGMTSPIANRE
jgi:pyridoxine kinase